ncbi:hypothetical protein MRX96_017601 [Rhipicephalus microplus]
MSPAAEDRDVDVQDDHGEQPLPTTSRSEELPGPASPSGSECAVKTRSRSQTQVSSSSTHLSCVAVCSLLVLLTIAGVAITAYKMHAGDAVMALFKHSEAFLRLRGNATTTEDSSPLHDADSRYLVLHEKKVPSTRSSCQSDVCTWVENYLRGRIDTAINPCIDFYGHVCSSQWASRGLNLHSRVYRERTVGMMMMDIERFFRDYLSENEEPYHKYSGVFLHQAISLLPKCQSEEKDDKNLTSLRGLLEEYNLGNWPYKRAPRGSNIVAVSAFVDRDLGVFPFVRLFLQKPFEDDRMYTVHIDVPCLTLKRYNLAYPDEPPSNFTQKIALALSLLGKAQDVAEQSEAIAALETKLQHIMSAPRFVEFAERIKSIGQLDHKGKWSWKAYLNILFQDIETFDIDKTVAVMNHDYVTNLTRVLNETDTVTLLNYVGYRMVVHVSPLLAKSASPLLRLSHDNYLEFVPDRRQACMHLLERLYKHGMRFFARMTFSKNNSTLLLKHYDYSMSSLEVLLKSSMSDRLLSSSSWLDRSAIGIGVDKLENMRLVFLGSADDINDIASYYNFNAQPLDTSHLVESFRELQAGTMNVYWETRPPKGGLRCQVRSHGSFTGT